MTKLRWSLNGGRNDFTFRNLVMTRNANRNHIEPKLRGIAVVMMILFCLCRAVMALQGIRPGQSAISDSIIHSIYCPQMFRMANVKFIQIINSSFSTLFAFVVAFYYNLAFLALGIAFLNGFVRFALTVTFFGGLAFFAFSITFFRSALADFAISLMTIFGFRMFVELRDWFDFFASAASFRYDLLRHFRFSNKRLCLEPVAGHTPAVGSLYYTNLREINQE